MSWPACRASGPVLAPARHPAEDEPLVSRQADVGAEAEALHHPRPEALDQRIRLLHESQHDLDPGPVLQVEGDGSPPTAEHLAEGVRVAGRRPVDPDHVGAEVGEQHRPERRRADARELDDPEVGERSLTPGHFTILSAPSPARDRRASGHWRPLVRFGTLCRNERACRRRSEPSSSRSCSVPSWGSARRALP